MRRPTGDIYLTALGWRCRVLLPNGKRKSFAMPACQTEAQARARGRTVAEQAARLKAAKRADSAAAIALLEELARCADDEVRDVITVVASLCAGHEKEIVIDTERADVLTFREVSKLWTDGTLADRYPDHVKRKRSVQDDEERLDHVCGVVHKGRAIGDTPIDEVTLDHFEALKANMPDTVRAASTRRQYCQAMRKVLEMAVYPLRLIDANPVTKGAMPVVQARAASAYPFLYPAEDAKLLACRAVPLELRMVFGFMAREGCRAGEVAALDVADFNLELGIVSIDANKTDDPRSWALDPGVVTALAWWFASRGAEPSDPAFVDPTGGRLRTGHLAARFRRWLARAGVDRRQLHEAGTNTRRARAHELRSTFVTLALANGRTETWVADRTGHKSSAMINRYRRQSRQAREVGLGWLKPLAEAIPEGPNCHDIDAASTIGSEAGPLGQRAKRVSRWVPEVGLEPTHPKAADFESSHPLGTTQLFGVSCPNLGHLVTATAQDGNSVATFRLGGMPEPMTPAPMATLQWGTVA